MLSFFCAEYPLAVPLKAGSSLEDRPLLLCGTTPVWQAEEQARGSLCGVAVLQNYWLFCFAGSNRGGFGVC